MRKIFIKGLVLLPILILTFQAGFGQGWVQTHDIGTGGINSRFKVTPDGIYSVTNSVIMEADSVGEILWVKDQAGSNAKEAVFTDKGIFARSKKGTADYIVGYDYEGNLLWEDLLDLTFGSLHMSTLVKSKDGGVALFGNRDVGFGEKELIIKKWDENGGKLLDQQVDLPDSLGAFTLVAACSYEDGNYFAIGYIGSASNTIAIKIGENGGLIWVRSLTNNSLLDPFVYSLIETTDHGILIAASARDGVLFFPYLMKLDDEGYNEWVMKFEGEYFNGVFGRIIELPSGNLLWSSFKTTSGANAPSIQKSYLKLISKDGELIRQKELNFFPNGNISERMTDMVYLDNNKLLLGGEMGYPVNDAGVFSTHSELLMAMVDTLGNLYPHFLQGTVFQDQALDCQFDNVEARSPNNVVQFKKGASDFYATTDDSGNYLVNLPSGDYEVSVQNNHLWKTCQPTYFISIDNTNDTTGLDMPMQPKVLCPLMQVDIATPRLRLCTEGYYTVNYCNVGTIEAGNATIEVSLADGLTFLNADMPLLSQNGQTLTFDLGTVGVIECNSFRIDFQVTCDEEFFGQTQCTEAHIYPDGLCNNSYVGPDIHATGFCQNDTIHFNIINEGEDMQSPQQYIVIEDNIILMTDDFQLLQGEAKASNFAATSGATYYLVAAQDPTLPVILGNPIATAVVEGCVGEVNEGAFSQFPANDGEPWISIDCHPIVASFDPNDKTAFPSGWTEDHLIEVGTDLEYLIRFQNTGTDTAFKVVIVDTLSQFLDPSTIRPGAGSHPFTYSLTGQGVAIFTFDNILLPDSTTNEAASHGFVKFSISQKPGNEIGTRIENTAYIYFDYNSAVQTNTVFHTIGEPWVQVVSGSLEVSELGVQVAVFPNPFYETATVELDGWQGRGGTFVLFDMNGRAVLQKEFIGEKITLERGEIPAGIYFFKIENEGKIIGSGKVVVR
jgi:uncharacterized repeat protein (TIGR01451 family)